MVFAEEEKQILYLMMGLKQHFKLKDPGSPKQCLGIELNWSERATLQTRQTLLIDKLPKETEMDQASVKVSPVSPSFSHNESLDADQLGAEEHRKYRSNLGTVMYLDTRPHLGVVPSMLGADVKHATVKHMANAKRVLQYLREPADKEMILRSDKDNQLTAYDMQARRKRINKSKKIDR